MVLIGGLVVRRTCRHMGPSSDRSAVFHGALNLVAKLDCTRRVRIGVRPGFAFFRGALFKVGNKIWRGGTFYLKPRAFPVSCSVRGAAREDRTRWGCGTKSPPNGN